jgi:hypothetical protein
MADNINNNNSVVLALTKKARKSIAKFLQIKEWTDPISAADFAKWLVEWNAELVLDAFIRKRNAYLQPFKDTLSSRLLEARAAKQEAVKLPYNENAAKQFATARNAANKANEKLYDETETYDDIHEEERLAMTKQLHRHKWPIEKLHF